MLPLKGIPAWDSHFNVSYSFSVREPEGLHLSYTIGYRLNVSRCEGLPGMNAKDSHRFSFKIFKQFGAPFYRDTNRSDPRKYIQTQKAGFHAKETGHSKPPSPQKESAVTTSSRERGATPHHQGPSHPIAGLCQPEQKLPLPHTRNHFSHSPTLLP